MASSSENDPRIKYLQRHGIAMLDDTNNPDDVVMKIFGSRARVQDEVTHIYFPDKRIVGNWCHAGGESYYYVAKIKTGFTGTKLAAMKAVVSSGGDCSDRALTESTRMVALGRHSAELYGVGPGTIVKEWITPDSHDYYNEVEIWDDLRNAMMALGLSILGNTDRDLSSAAFISQGIAKVFDAGWDMTGDVQLNK